MKPLPAPGHAAGLDALPRDGARAELRHAREPGPPRASGPPRERGVALLLAVFILTSFTLIALFLAASLAVNRRTSSDDVTKLKALRVAEAGVAEALNRIQNGLGPDPAAANAPRQVVQILLTAAPGVAGVDTTLMATGQPVGQYLQYSTPAKGGDALTIAFETNPARTQVRLYDKTQNPPQQFTSGSPIYRITSVGTVGRVSRRLVVDAVRPVSYDLRGAVVSGVDIKYTGSGVDCGFNHRATTPYPAGQNARTGAGGCDVWEVGSGDVPGTLAYGTFTKTGPSLDYGTPPVVSGAVGFYAGPWEVFGMSQAAFFAWVGPPAGKPAVLNGVYYVDNDGVPQNQSCNISYAGAITGSGFLYVDGDLTMNNNFHFTGLIYCEGKFTATNDAWVLGSVIARGRAGGRNDMTGPNTFLFSREAVGAITGAPVADGRVKVIAWKETP